MRFKDLYDARTVEEARSGIRIFIAEGLDTELEERVTTQARFSPKLLVDYIRAQGIAAVTRQMVGNTIAFRDMDDEVLTAFEAATAQLADEGVLDRVPESEGEYVITDATKTWATGQE